MRRQLVIVGIGLIVAAAVGARLAGILNSPLYAQPADERHLQSRLTLAAGYKLNVYASGLERPRLMQITEGGDLIVSESDNGKIVLVKRDAADDGKSDGEETLKDGLNEPHGLWLDGNKLYVAEESRVMRYRFDGERLTGGKAVLEGLPTGGGHSTRTIKRGPDGYFYVTAGASCNVCIEKHPWRAAMIRFSEGAGKPELFASGLRNTVGFDWQPSTGILYGVDNGRDGLGDDVPPEELNVLHEHGFYGWPYRHGIDIVDPDYGKDMPENLSPTPPVHTFIAHSAPLSIRFLRNQKDPAMNGTALVAFHGSWNRSKKSGYAILKLIWKEDGTISDEPFMTGCVKNEKVACRPVDILEAPDGTIFVSDDYAGAIYRITPALQSSG
jgi:glucose/arabinose dehydrogenase